MFPGDRDAPEDIVGADDAERRKDSAGQAVNHQPDEGIRRTFMDEGGIDRAAHAQEQRGYAYQLHKAGIHPVFRRFAAMRRVFLFCHAFSASTEDLRHAF